MNRMDNVIVLYKYLYMNSLFNKIALNYKGMDKEFEALGAELIDLQDVFAEEIKEELNSLGDFSVNDFIWGFTEQIRNDELKQMGVDEIRDLSWATAKSVMDFLEEYNKISRRRLLGD